MENTSPRTSAPIPNPGPTFAVRPAVISAYALSPIVRSMLLTASQKEEEGGGCGDEGSKCCGGRNGGTHTAGPFEGTGSGGSAASTGVGRGGK